MANWGRVWNECLKRLEWKESNQMTATNRPPEPRFRVVDWHPERNVDQLIEEIKEAKENPVNKAREALALLWNTLIAQPGIDNWSELYDGYGVLVQALGETE